MHKREFNAIRTPIHQDAFDLDPAYQAELALVNEINWTFAIMMGQAEGKQVPLACDGDGVLTIADASGALAEIAGQLKGTDTANSPWWQGTMSLARLQSNANLDVIKIRDNLESSTDEISLADYFEETANNLPFYGPTDGYGLAEYFDSTSQFAPLYESNYGVAYWMKQIYDILYACYNGGGDSGHLNVEEQGA